jgi:hypothetical protein
LSGSGPTKRNKYRNKPTEIDGIEFPSQKEAGRWVYLSRLQKAGRISGLRRQVTFPLRVNGAIVARYRADFVYLEDGVRVVEDTKGVRTAVFKLKRRLMMAIYDIEIRET